MRATDGTIRLPSIACAHRDRVAQFVAVSTGVILAAAVFLLSRRIAGAFDLPLPPLQLLATVVLTTAWALLVRELSSRSPLYTSLVLIILLALAIACSHPGARVIDWLLWPAAMFAVVLCPPIPRLAATRSGARSAISHAIVTEHESNTEQILQQLTRVRTEEGHEAIHGTLTGEFAPGQRQATLYVAFCPPFERLPHVEANVADDSDATLKITQLQHNGAHIEVRLPQPASENMTVAIEFFATDAETSFAV